MKRFLQALIVLFISCPFLAYCIEGDVMVGPETGIVVSDNDLFLTDGAVSGDTMLIVWSQNVTGTEVFVPKAKLIHLVNNSGDIIDISAQSLLGAPAVASDGEHFLVAWGESTSGDGSLIRGQFISISDASVTPAFDISTAAGSKELADIAFVSDRYLVVWVDERNETKDIYGQLVSPGGILEGSEVVIAAGAYNQKDPSVEAGDSNFLVVWSDGARLGQGYGEDVLGRIVTPTGSFQGDAFVISQNNYPSDNPTDIEFDGEKYFVTWMEEVGGSTSGEWDIRGQFVSQAGTLTGTELIISAQSGGQLFPSVAYINERFVVTWTDLRNDSNNNFVFDEGEGTGADIYGQTIDQDGNLIGTEFVISSAENDQLGAAIRSSANDFRVLWTDNRTGLHENYDLQYGDIYGATITTEPVAAVDNEYAPAAFILAQNNPNPFNPSTTISFTLTNSQFVSLAVYSATGQKIGTLINNRMDAGTHAAVFDGTGMSSGIYYYCMQAGGIAETGKMLLLK